MSSAISPERRRWKLVARARETRGSIAARGLWIALAVCLLMLTTTLVARADPAVCIVRIARPADNAMLDRILGQTSDLPLKIVPLRGPIEVDRGVARARAAALA